MPEKTLEFKNSRRISALELPHGRCAIARTRATTVLHAVRDTGRSVCAWSTSTCATNSRRWGGGCVQSARTTVHNVCARLLASVRTACATCAHHRKHHVRTVTATATGMCARDARTIPQFPPRISHGGCAHRARQGYRAVGSQHLRLRNHIFGLTHRIMVKRLETSPHDPLGITDSACKNQSVMVSVQYGPFNTNIPIRSTTIGKSRVARDPITMHTSWRSNSDIACVTRMSVMEAERVTPVSLISLLGSVSHCLLKADSISGHPARATPHQLSVNISARDPHISLDLLK
ncbi:hypothetical protein F511_36543 [Dorcoceras hygrometricum]|uniref:Uncharacterized protein n=1 Tax=Dorcoceras hygrometricum TaxID=472368 RepID=A0A2Z7D0U5_9LAMI|nr:hypothetical protein F511_36543 [Dorcoceras hygrometricum]